MSELKGKGYKGKSGVVYDKVLLWGACAVLCVNGRKWGCICVCVCDVGVMRVKISVCGDVKG